MSFVAITLYVASQRVFVVLSIYFVIDSVRKRFDTPSYIHPVLLCRSEVETAMVQVPVQEILSNG